MNTIILCVLLYAGVSINMSITMMGPFFPKMLINVGLDQFYNGLIFAIIAFPYFLTPCFVGGILLPKYGRPHTFLMGSALISISMFAFGALAFITNQEVFLGLAIISRIGASFGNTMAIGASFAMVSVQFPHKVGKYTALFSAALCIGLSIAPFIGGLMFDLFGESGPFFFVGFATLLQALLVLLYYKEPSHLISTPQLMAHSQSPSAIQFLHILKIPRSLIAYLNFWLSMSMYMFINSALSIQLMDSFQFDQAQVSWFFFACMGTMCVVSLLLSFCKQSFDKRNILVPSNFVLIVGLLMIGPSQTFSIPNSKQIVLCGLFISGAGIGTVYSLTVEEVVKASRQYFTDYNELVNKVASLRLFFSAFCYFTGSLPSSALVELFGFSKVCEINAMAMGVFIAIQLITFVLSKRGLAVSSRLEEMKQPLLN